MTDLENKVISQISQLERLENVMVDGCITGLGDRQDVDDDKYIIDVNKAEYTTDDITYIRFGISVNPKNGDEPLELVDEVESIVNGFELSYICKAENLDDYNQLVEDGCGTEDWGAITYIYEVYSEEF